MSAIASSTENASERAVSFNAALGIALCLSLHLAFIVFEARFPGTDIFLFKDAGANWALDGRLVAKNLPNLERETETLFSYYPPLYPVLYGLWSRIVGFGLTQSLLFETFIRLARTLLLGWALAGSIRRAAPSRRWMALTLLALSSFLGSDGDRPDDLALCFGLLSVLLLQRRIFWGGLSLGLCAAASPTAGAFFGLVVVLGSLGRGWSWRALLAVVGISALVFLSCTLPIQWMDPESARRFSKQVPLSVFPYYAYWAEGQGWLGTWYGFRGYMYHWWFTAKDYIICTAGAALSGLLALFALGKTQAPHFPLLVAALLFIPVCAIVWTLQPYYLWFACVALLGSAAAGILTAKSQFRALAIFIPGLLAMTLLGAREAKNLVNGLQTAPNTRLKPIREQLLSTIAPGKRVAITPDAYFLLKGYREISNIIYVCGWIRNFDYVYALRFQNARTASGTAPTFPCHVDAACFKPVSDLRDSAILKIAGWDSPFYVRNYAGVLYENTCPRG